MRAPAALVVLETRAEVASFKAVNEACILPLALAPSSAMGQERSTMGLDSPIQVHCWR